MGLVEYIHPSLAAAEWSRPSVKAAYIAGAFLSFCSVYAISALMSTVTTQTYRKLQTKEVVFWNLAVVRGVYGLFCIVFGTWAIFMDTDLVGDVVFATSPSSHFAMTTTVGFFIFECGMILWSDIYFRQFNFLLNLHHWISLLAYSLLIYMGSTHFFGTRGLILEMSTPFSCLCWTLLKADMAHTLLWKANQFLLVHTFHLRSVAECAMWYWTYQHWNRIWAAMPLGMFVFLYTQLSLVTFIMTPYWTYKKTTQMINPVDWNFEDSVKYKHRNGEIKRE
ncbi:protein CLN8-like [Mya arenaria]|uniref:protein CLN8-like n=1 Tax=Mya arenaria TaxID=6604 RepID=UPI0022E041CA|nr:protein CLN8-like [Mya arenaria]